MLITLEIYVYDLMPHQLCISEHRRDSFKTSKVAVVLGQFKHVPSISASSDNLVRRFLLWSGRGRGRGRRGKDEGVLQSDTGVDIPDQTNLIVGREGKNKLRVCVVFWSLCVYVWEGDGVVR